MFEISLAHLSWSSGQVTATRLNATNRLQNLPTILIATSSILRFRSSVPPSPILFEKASDLEFAFLVLAFSFLTSVIDLDGALLEKPELHICRSFVYSASSITFFFSFIALLWVTNGTVLLSRFDLECLKEILENLDQFIKSCKMVNMALTNSEGSPK
ncbi:hypothetical protein OPV22_002364 [Ensete ventricosum]|uniref:Transmembrane protein n=1 Tax=Ensete ventricosum TaxID=4639 RepID=A0AAV8RXT1_ENSVE|nr:hypothetical protein OPV22_002364 [Ensete ventricosum]